MFGSHKSDVHVDKALNNTKVELALAHKDITKLQLQISNLKDTIEELHSIAKSKEETYNGQLAQFKSDMVKLQNSINARVNETLATVGVSQFAIETICNSVETSPEQIVRKFNSLQVMEQREFYNKHKDVIDKTTNSNILIVKP